MKPGQTEFFDITQSDGTVIQYEFDFLKIHLHKTNDAKIAKKWMAHVSTKADKALFKATKNTARAAIASVDEQVPAPIDGEGL
jgi:6-phosphogluconolactonase (cycloisomerase 2 family)